MNQVYRNRFKNRLLGGDVFGDVHFLMDGVDLTRFLFLRALAVLYLIAFLIVYHQFRPLCGKEGILPARLFLSRVSFKQAPSIFWWDASDVCFKRLSLLGIFLSLFALSSISDCFGVMPFFLTWFSLWVIYLSFVNVGQVFYGFGWESLLLETGFLVVL